ncbi:relaxase/mobilization nuclease domain-containing protein [Pseudooceanicola atlanticus]|uniref:relaxase/mobilization nuclease domain-containing protein n=1 Tax=Pseudooceanicola atlanticus TaxID=1461694 RepID=UPI002355AEB3|nr:relaxase/mobilization nuclease domain-containing protein [Pseudooceanicola atlanticus]
MIIKSMSRKAPTFAQLAAYIGRNAGPGSGTAFVRNIYAGEHDQKAVVAQFLDNYRYLPERKGGNALYHELIALEPQQHLSPAEVEDALHELAEQYCTQRAPHQLAWGRVHHDTEFPHMHLMISANAIRSDRRVRMDRAYFARVQRDLERWQAANLPQLKATIVYGHDHEKQTPKQPIQEGEMVRRTQAPSRKQEVCALVGAVLAAAKDQVEFSRRLQRQGFEVYQRGNAIGVIDQGTGNRYRLRTLGLDRQFRQLPATEQTLKQNAAPEVTDDRAADLLQRRLDTAARDHLHDAERDRPERE